MTYASALQLIENILIPKYSDKARTEAQILLAFYLNLPLPTLVQTKDRLLTAEQAEEIKLLAQRRSTGEPLQYILGRCEFLDLNLKVGPGVLIPRLDSEAMILKGLEHLQALDAKKLRVLDLGAGSGALGLALIKNTNAELKAVEVSSEARSYLKQNIHDLGVADRAEIVNLDLDNSIEVRAWKQQAGCFEIIVANPPYIDRADVELDLDVKTYEPELALYASNKGLEKIWSWSQSVIDLLSSDGIYLCEIGWRQAADVREWHAKTYSEDYELDIYKDLSGKDRFFSMRLKR